jgi:hypothetical protein
MSKYRAWLSQSCPACLTNIKVTLNLIIDEHSSLFHSDISIGEKVMLHWCQLLGNSSIRIDLNYLVINETKQIVS